MDNELLKILSDLSKTIQDDTKDINNQSKIENKLENAVDQITRLTELRAATRNPLKNFSDNSDNVEYISETNWKDIMHRM